MKKNSERYLFFLFFFLHLESLLGQPNLVNSNLEEPIISSESDSLSIKLLDREGILRGHVKLIYNSTSLFADQIKIGIDNLGFKYGIASMKSTEHDPKNSVTISVVNCEKSELIEGKGLIVNFNQKGQFELIGKASITRYISGKITEHIEGERILYFQPTKSYQVFGNTKNVNLFFR